ncbi:MAG TPA: LacI family DNA-binding transcriptional regulator [Alloacidobacterium sp.]|nr:LacI family DNA-binding transcriptional regulator [Alloacidobacterium sp.]
MKISRKNRPTLHDVAKAAGVGTTTVSRVINGGHYVGPEMLARIQSVMAELGYQPNEAARSLKSERSRTIGLIIPSITDPFFARFAEVVEVHARREDYVVILLTSQDRAQLELEDLQIFERHRVDGLLVVPPRSGSSSKALLQSLRRLSVPVVAFDRPTTNRAFSSVVSDNYAAAQQAVRHLMGHGRRRILCLGGDPNLYTICERVKGSTDALASAGFEVLVEMSASDYASAEAAIMKHMAGKHKLDAIFGLYNQSTILAYEVMQNYKIRVPQAVSLIGFDDFALAATLRPSITVVKQSIEELARTATQLLLNHMKGETHAPQQIEIASSLVIRQSCGCKAPRESLRARS